MTSNSTHTQSHCAGVGFAAKPSRRRLTGSLCGVSAVAALLGRALMAVCAALMLCMAPAAMAANDSSKHFEIKAEPLAEALMEFGAQSGLTVVAPTTLTAGKNAPALHGDLAWTDALGRLLQGSGLTFTQDAGGTIVIQKIGSGAPAKASSEPIDQDQGQLADVIVTAQKRSENLLQVAAPVTAVQATDLARQGDVRLADYAASVPGLNLMSSEPGQTSIAVRGITTGFGFAIAATTSVYIDDSPIGSSTANAIGSISTIDLDPATLQSVEVLRGPQGTLYGANSMGGLIKYVTIPPSLTKDSGRVELDGSAVDGGGQGYGVRGMWNGPLVTDKLGVTIDAYDRYDPGYIDDPLQHRDDVNSSHVAGGRLATLWQPTEQFSAELSALVQNLSTPSTSAVDVNANLTPIYGKYQQVRYVGEDWVLDNALYSFRANYEFGWATLTSITTYQKQRANTHTDFTNRFGGLLSSIIGVPDLGVVDHVTLADHKITQEVRLASPATDKLEWLGGLYFTHEKSVQPETMTGFTLPDALPVPGLGPLFVDPNNDSYKEYAGYADLTYHVTSKFKVLGGLRYTSDSEDNVTPFSGLFNGPPAIAITSTGSRSTTYNVSPSYSFNQHEMVYARVATGFRPGGPTGLTTTSVYAGAPATYNPDTLTNYEVGYKAGFPGERMTVDLSVFDIEWKKIQVLSEIGGFIITGNGASARSNGIEFAWTWRATPGLDLSANADYTHAYLTTDAPGIGGNAGDNLPAVPEFSGNLAADYAFTVSSAANGFVGGNVAYEGARFSNFVTGLPPTMTRTVLPSYPMLNLHAGLDYNDVTIETYVKNVSNSYAFSQISSEANDGFSPPLAAALIQPRTFGLSATYKF
jgi:iron complex outermembrane recepter protein